MATAARTFTRALRTSARPAFAAAPRAAAPRTAFTAAPRSGAAALRRAAFQQGGRRYYSSESSSSSESTEQKSGSGRTAAIAGALALVAIAGYYATTLSGSSGPRTAKDYQAVYDVIASRLEENDEYDDGSYGPVLVRLAWHASGTFDKQTGTGGSNGATMRFAPESDHGANAGLKAARDFLEPVKKQFPWITYSDLWILGGVCAIQEMLGPNIPFRPGREDKDVAACTPDGRLPDASQAHDHLRNIFYRMGFNDQEIVALAGAHALGRCHPDRSGYSGPWTFSPTVLTNDFYKLLLDEKWQYKKWDGPKQFEDKKTGTLMMLPADMALVQDKKFNEWVKKYAADNDLFFKDFSAVIVKLFELGVPFKEDVKPFVLKTSN
ncbi:heme peroxidase [Chaetomium sp. MPI-SDFR-AT-0129]|nr:heme peroxidase [Chaetomium sp. MPI-SDFR-AT-0129]